MFVIIRMANITFRKQTYELVSFTISGYAYYLSVVAITHESHRNTNSYYSFHRILQKEHKKFTEADQKSRHQCNILGAHSRSEQVFQKILKSVKTNALLFNKLAIANQKISMLIKTGKRAHHRKESYADET